MDPAILLPNVSGVIAGETCEPSLLRVFSCLLRMSLFGSFRAPYQRREQLKCPFWGSLLLLLS